MTKERDKLKREIEQLNVEIRFVFTLKIFSFSTAIFVKYNLLTKYLTIFWFAMLVNVKKILKKIEKCKILTIFVFGNPPPPLL